MTHPRRQADETVDDYQHRLIRLDVEALQATIDRGAGRYQRREAYKQAVWTIQGHLSGHHGRRYGKPHDTPDALLELHQRMHEPPEGETDGH